MQAKKQVTRQKIYKAAISCLELTPTKKLTVVAVVRQARISRRTFYRYYPNIDSLVADVEHQLWSDLLQIFSPLFSASKWADLTFVTHLFHYLDTHHSLLKFLYFTDHFNFTEAVIQNAHGITQRRLHELAPATTIDVQHATDLVLQCLGYGAQALINEWIRHDFQEPASQMAYLYYQLVIAPFFTLNDRPLQQQITQIYNDTQN